MKRVEVEPGSNIRSFLTGNRHIGTFAERMFTARRVHYEEYGKDLAVTEALALQWAQAGKLGLQNSPDLVNRLISPSQFGNFNLNPQKQTDWGAVLMGCTMFAILTGVPDGKFYQQQYTTVYNNYVDLLGLPKYTERSVSEET